MRPQTSFAPVRNCRSSSMTFRFMLSAHDDTKTENRVLPVTLHHLLFRVSAMHQTLLQGKTTLFQYRSHDVPKGKSQSGAKSLAVSSRTRLPRCYYSPSSYRMIAPPTIVAVSAFNIASPSETRVNPHFPAVVNSSSVQPPSGPIK